MVRDSKNSGVMTLGHLALNGGTKVRRRPFPTWPVYDETDARALAEVLWSGKWGSLYGEETSRFAQEFAEFHHAKHGVCVANCSVALEVALKACGVGIGEEVIMPAYTFVATATATLSLNAVPVFVDIDPETYNIDPKAVEAAITPRTRAIMPVHVGGNPCDMDALVEVAKRHEVALVEDAAQAHGAEWRGRRVGAIGDAGCFSFQSSKNLSCGEGGIVLTDDEELAAHCWSLHNCGRTPKGAWYEHRVLGWNYRMTEFQAALLRSQLKRLPEQMAVRDANAQHLARLLEQVPGIKPVKWHAGATRSSHHLFILRYDKSQFKGLHRDRFVEAMQAEGIECTPGYVPLYRERLFYVDPGQYATLDGKPDPRLDYSKLHLAACEHACNEEAVWLYQKLLLGTKEDVEDIVQAIVKIHQHVDELISVPV